jgi:hypothetical protein
LMDNNRMDLGDVGWCDVDWIGLTQDRNRWELLWIRYWTFGFHEMLGNYRVAQHLVASRVVLSSMELVSLIFNLISSEKNSKLHGLTPRSNCADRATAACGRSDCQLLRIEGATWSAWWIPTAVFSVF